MDMSKFDFCITNLNKLCTVHIDNSDHPYEVIDILSTVLFEFGIKITITDELEDHIIVEIEGQN